MKYYACIIVLLFQLAGSMLADNTAVRESGAAFYFRNIVTTIGKAFAPFGFRNAELQSNTLRVPFKSSGDEPPVMDGGVVAMIESEPVVEPEPKPKPVVEPEPEPVVEPEPKPVVEPEPAVEDRVAEPEPAPESSSNSAPDFVDPESMTEEDLFLQLFGIKKPKSMGIDVDARVFLDDMLVGKAIIKSDTNFSFYKISTEKLINYVTPFLKKGVVSDLKKMFAEMEYLDKAALTSAGFSVIFSGARQRLSIKTPVEMRGVQTIDFSKAMFGAYAQNDFETHWFSGYFDIN